MKTMTLELLVNSWSLEFMSSGDKAAGAAEGATLFATGVAEECDDDGADDGDFENFAMIFESSGGLAPSTRPTSLPT